MVEKRKEPSTALYRQIIECLRARKGEIGWSFWQLDEAAGTQSGYAAKAFRPDTPSGRQARWETLQWMIDAMYPSGNYRLFLVPDKPLKLGGDAAPLARLMALLAMSGCHGYEAAKLLAEIGIEVDRQGGLVIDRAKAAEQRRNRRKKMRDVSPARKDTSAAAPVSTGLNRAA